MLLLCAFSSLPYLKAGIKETLLFRLSIAADPPAFSFGQQNAPQEGPSIAPARSHSETAAWSL